MIASNSFLAETLVICLWSLNSENKISSCCPVQNTRYVSDDQIQLCTQWCVYAILFNAHTAMHAYRPDCMVQYIKVYESY
jgi:hypothetical protein